jgi:aminodeoxyfutalosine deaminase
MLLSADKIHDGQQWLAPGSVLEIDEQSGNIIAIHPHLPNENILHFEGMICPGFINAHCHAELSHMKGAIAEHTGLTGFLQQVMHKRNDYSDAQKETARNEAVQEMYDNGIVAVGDIANTIDTLSLREKGLLHWYTFVESIGFNPARAQSSFDYACKIWSEFAAQKTHDKLLQQSIVAHAPYSVSSDLFALIAAHQPERSMSVHNQESAAENEYYQSKTGAFVNFLKGIGIDDSTFSASSKSSLQTYAYWILEEKPLILVHNSFSIKSDIEFAIERFKQLYWCLCPNANLYIENQLPDIPLLMSCKAQICIGTDSLASNHQLSILAELLSINRQFPEIGWEQLLRWATWNGACALQMQQEIGRIEAHKRPGILWIKKDFSLKKLY